MDITNLLPNKDDQRKGKWFNYDPWGDVEFLIASQTTREVRQEVAKKIKVTRKGRIDTRSADKILEENVEFLADHCIKGWRNLDLNGEPFEFNRENTIKLLDASSEFTDWVHEISNDEQNFIAEHKEAAVENLKSGAEVGDGSREGSGVLPGPSGRRRKGTRSTPEPAGD